ncbi:hypothetical protein CERSUDRAFT_87995 [Gelatoporia subvermispora B]|uniref:LysM domain-containing protein n=1 Tax=Ceriporiopsis subvermispora (strain B) TaxID=914234 RepID=M2PA41_CERS8|nr:hypothetical protein CERSUDRAFT_87995 [Gelatoporia subvermispora B]
MFAFIRAAVALAAAAAGIYSVANAQTGCERFYVIKVGDTCDSIAAANNVSTFQLQFINPDIDAGCDNLFPGTIICLGIAGEDCETIHVVQPGDFCAEIADEAGIPISTLLANNPNVNANCTNIDVGEVLCTADEVFNYTSVTV